MTRITRLFTSVLAAAAVVALTACGSSAPAAKPAEKPKAPDTIAALDYETAEVLASFGLGDRIVLMPEAVRNPVLGSHQEELAKVPNTFPVASEIDAEQIIDLFPRVTIVSPRHHQDRLVGDVLEGAGLEVLRLDYAWGNMEQTIENIALIGKVTHSDEKAKEIITELVTKTKATRLEGTAPRIAVLTNQAGRPFLTAGEAMPLDLLSRTGAIDISSEMEAKTTGPISAEQLVEANPDGIVLIDMNGSGDKIFQELLGNEAVASLDAVSQDKILRVQGKEVQALGLTNMIGGLKKLREFVESLA